MALHLARTRNSSVNSVLFIGDGVTQTVTFDLRDAGFNPPLNSQPIEVRIGSDTPGIVVTDFIRWNVTLFFSTPPSPGGAFASVIALY